MPLQQVPHCELCEELMVRGPGPARAALAFVPRIREPVRHRHYQIAAWPEHPKQVLQRAIELPRPDVFERLTRGNNVEVAIGKREILDETFDERDPAADRGIRRNGRIG